MTSVTRFVLPLALAAGCVGGAPAEAKRTPAGRTPVRLAEDYQVLQRGDDDTASFVVKLPDAVKDGTAFKVVAWKELGAAETKLQRPAQAASIASVGKGLLVEGLPTGGPYTVEIVPDGGPATKAVFRHVLVGDLWLTGGQSNMFGGDLLGEDLPPLPRVNLLDTLHTHLDAHWCDSTPPLHRLDKALGTHTLKVFYPGITDLQVDRFYESKRAVGGVGPAYFFARKLAEESGVPVGVIPCAMGGSLAVWEPKSPDPNQRGQRYPFVRHHVARAGGRVKGLIWAQGAQDCIFGNWDRTVAQPGFINPLSTYADKFKEFIDALREDCDNPDLVVISAQECRQHYPPYYAARGYEGQNAELKKTNPDLVKGRSWERLREVQRQVVGRVRNMHLVPMVDLDVSDGIHVDYASHKRLGARMARCALPYVKKGTPRQTEVKLNSVEVDRSGKFPKILVAFDGVTGRLTAPGRPTGFTLRNRATGADDDWVFRTDFDPARPGVVVLSTTPGCEFANFQLYYGGGAAPYVNIVDEADMAVPAFGPVGLK
jgi:sialate O-acetylesterase